MEWFEELTGISPDNGTGTFEAMFAALVGVAIIVIAGYLISRHRTRTAR